MHILRSSLLEVLEEGSHQYSASSFSSPERRLLLAVLFRAFLDLESHAAPLDRKSAIRWFRSPLEDSFSFQGIVKEFGLAKWCTSQLDQKIEDAIAYEQKRKEEAKKLGIVISMHHPVRQTKHHSCGYRVTSGSYRYGT